MAQDPDTKLTSQSLVDLAYHDLQMAIAAGEIAEGEPLVINRLAKKYGMSLIPVREALVRLSSERFVTFERNKGYRVAPRPTAEEMAQLFQARLIIEVGAVETGFKAIDSQTIAKLNAVNDALRGVQDAKTRKSHLKFIRLNEEFHVLIVGALGNPFILDAYNHLRYHQRIMLTHFEKGVPDGKRIINEHEEIIRALVEGDPTRAVEAMRGHIEGGFSRFAVT